MLGNSGNNWSTCRRNWLQGKPKILKGRSAYWKQKNYFWLIWAIVKRFQVPAQWVHSERSTAGCSLRKRPSWPRATPGGMGITESWEGSEVEKGTLLVYSGSEKETLFIFSMSSVVKSFKLLKMKLWFIYEEYLGYMWYPKRKNERIWDISIRKTQ